MMARKRIPLHPLPTRAGARVCAAAALVFALTAIGGLAPAWGSGHDTRWSGSSWEVPAMTGYSATLEQCVSSAVALQRSVTFTGQMAAVAGTQRMGMRIELEERAPGQTSYHEVSAPGLGVWRGSEPGVKIYRYVKQITNLSAPAVYRAVVHFRWVGERGRVLRHAELRTARCSQPLISDEGGSSGAQTAPAG